LTISPDGRPLDEQPKWRQDFPIDWPQAHYLSRRDFTKFMVLISLAFTAGQFWIVLKNFMRRRRGQPPIQHIATTEQLPVGGFKTFMYPEAHDTCLLMRPSENTFEAFSQKCTHLSCAVVPQPDKNRFYCPCHEGSFDLATGAPIAGPPQRPLSRITLEIHGSAIYATGVEVKTI
jgi:Rieske Fe-S protein